MDRARKLDEHELETARAVGCVEDDRWHVRKDGSSFWASGITMHLAEQGGFVKIFRDATHLRARTAYLENVLNERLGRETEQDLFVATIAHELRNPLAPLKTVLELLKRTDETGDLRAKALQIMDRQLGFLERMVEDLVDLMRVKRGKLRINRQATTLQELLTEALESCSGTAERRTVQLIPVLPSVPLDIEVDVERLMQVVVNLLNNAIKFTPPGGSVWLTATADQTHFLVYVRDNGKGIEGDLLPRLFEAFTQADGADTQRGAGLGIGLSVVKEIVSLHQGTVEVRSEGEGKGAEFTVRIPLRPSEVQQEPPDTRPGN